MFSMLFSADGHSGEAKNVSVFKLELVEYGFYPVPTAAGASKLTRDKLHDWKKSKAPSRLLSLFRCPLRANLRSVRDIGVWIRDLSSKAVDTSSIKERWPLSGACNAHIEAFFFLFVFLFVFFFKVVVCFIVLRDTGHCKKKKTCTV